MGEGEEGGFEEGGFRAEMLEGGFLRGETCVLGFEEGDEFGEGAGLRVGGEKGSFGVGVAAVGRGRAGENGFGTGVDVHGEFGGGEGRFAVRAGAFVGARRRRIGAVGGLIEFGAKSLASGTNDEVVKASVLFQVLSLNEFSAFLERAFNIGVFAVLVDMVLNGAPG